MTTGTRRDRPSGDELVTDMLRSGRSGEAADRAEQLLRTFQDPRLIAAMSVLYLVANFNLGRWNRPVYQAAQDQARTALEVYPEPAFVCQFHSLSATAAGLSGDLDAAIAHLLDGEQALAAATEPDPDTALAVRQLAWAQASIGFPESALALLEQHEVDLPQQQPPDVGILLDAALTLDHRGDSEGCLRQLDDLLRSTHRSADEPPLPSYDFVGAAYAAARLALLGGEPGVDVRQLLASAGAGGATAAESSNVVLYARTAVAIQALAEGRVAGAAEFLTSIPLDSPLGATEALRLRSIALTALGDQAGALAAERQGFRILSDRVYRMQHQSAQRAAGHPHDPVLPASLVATAVEALTDSLTGLPNRRHLDRRLVDIVDRRTPTALAMIDLDRFKQVNTVHGHVVGDRVLRQVADILAASVRTGDFVARYGGDEFMMLLPATSLTEARVIEDRVLAAMASAPWQDLAPGTPVGATFGWTEIGEHRTADGAVAAADRAMYDAKPRVT